jgi:hypothetical protein
MSLVCNRQREIADRHFRHWEEIEPGLLEGQLLDYWLDRGWARDYPERRSLYRLFAPFSGCNEREPLSRQELTAYALGE